jgi:predicted RNA binding protein YcfA (HicA-like mRNA interferase family)
VGILPVVRSREVVSALERAGFVVHHQTGSHLVLKHHGPPPRRVTVPMHARDVKRGTLRSIIREAGMSVEEFTALL